MQETGLPNEVRYYDWTRETPENIHRLQALVGGIRRNYKKMHPSIVG